MDIADVHSCPAWPLYCHQHEECLDHYQGGKANNPVARAMCPDYVSDCKNYCRECNCVGRDGEENRGDAFCAGLQDSCLHPEKYFKEPAQMEDAPLECPLGYMAVGVYGAGVSGATLDDTTRRSIIAGFTDIFACGEWCDNDVDCLAFTFHRGAAQEKFVCRRYNSDVANILQAEDQIMCKPTTAAGDLILNPACPFTVAGTFYQQTDPNYPACPLDAIFFGLSQGGFCCTGTCEKGLEGKDIADQVCAVTGNPTSHSFDECTGYQADRYCIWAAGAESKYDTSTWTDYTAKVSMSVHGTGAAGIVFRMTTPWDAASPRYWLKFQPENLYGAEADSYHSLVVTYV